MPKILSSINELFTEIDIHKNKSISFHHHLRNGDFVMNKVLSFYKEHNVNNINLFPSAIFPSYHTLLELIQNNQIDNISTNYINGPVAEYISAHGLPGTLTMQTHGGRARAIEEGSSKIDIAYIAAPTVDKQGNAIGYQGKSKCGALGYAIPDSIHAKIKVLITDNLINETIENPEIHGSNIDYIITIDQIGDPNGIVSGTTSITTNPIGVKIAKLTSSLLEETGYIKEGFSFQSGAGGVSLRVTENLKTMMKKKNIKASFFSGGITKYHVDMLEEGMVEYLYDVQCFDLNAIESMSKNEHHIPISASLYANPINPERVIKDLDIVILGATEIDTTFNVNVITDSHQVLMGGSGGHSDTASEAKISIIVSPLIKARIPIIKNNVTTITTLGEHIDCFVCERGIAINPKRQDLLEKLSNSKLPIYTIEELQELAHKFTKIPKETKKRDKIIGVVQDRTTKIIDQLYQK